MFRFFGDCLLSWLTESLEPPNKPLFIPWKGIFILKSDTNKWVVPIEKQEKITVVLDSFGQRVNVKSNQINFGILLFLWICVRWREANFGTSVSSRNEGVYISFVLKAYLSLLNRGLASCCLSFTSITERDEKISMVFSLLPLIIFKMDFIN